MKHRILCLTASAAMLLMSPVLQGKAPATPPEWGAKIDWQYGAESVTLPALQGAERLSDGDLTTAPMLTKGGEAGTEITFRFEKPLPVTMFRFAQNGACANHYKLLADTTGDGNFDLTAADRTDKEYIRKEWIELPVNKTVYALKLVAVSGQIGYRASFPNITELEIYSTETVKVNRPKSGGVRLETCEFIPVPAPGKREIDIRVCTDWWNWSMQGWEKVRDKTPLAEWGQYRNMINTLKELDVNSIRLFGEMDATSNFIPFPSKLVDKEDQKDWMKPLAEQLAKDGYPLYYFTHAWKIPFQKKGEQAPMPWRRWDYPYMQSDTLVGINENYKVVYPCVLCDDDYRVKWTQMMREALQNGAKGIYLMPDEWFFKGHNLARANCPSCTREFKKMFGYDAMPKLKAPEIGTNDKGQVMPPLPEDTEIYRKWKVFEYIKLAELFRHISADLKKEFPHAEIVLTDDQGAIDATNCRLEHTLAPDIIGSDPNADSKQVYGRTACAPHVATIAFMKRCEAAAAGRNKLLSSAGWGPADSVAPALTYNAVLPEVMLGASEVEVYRHNYIYMHNSASVYKKMFRMIRLLETWGIRQAEVPNLVCMLLSRPGEDWYYTKVAAMMDPAKQGKAVEFYLNLADESINKIIASDSPDDRQRFLAQDRFRGFGARLTMESLLASKGIPYKVAYTEQPENMKKLGSYRTIVIPFAYSLSRAAFEEIKKAVEGGTKLIIFEQLAPTDEFGNAYEKPLLAELVGKPGVTYIKESLSDNSANLRKLDSYINIINDTIKEDGYFFDSNGFPVSYIATKLPGDKGFILYLCNTGMRLPFTTSSFVEAPTARVSVGLPASGEYRMETYSSDSHEINVNAIRNSKTIQADDLKKFQIALEPQEVKLIRIYRP